MTYGLDEPVSIPMVLMYDTDMMKMYIAAAKGEYERAYLEQKDFAKEFGELYGPNANINKAYYDATKGAVNDAMNYLYLNGIDPLRSQEGRAYIAKVIRERPYAEIANLKALNDAMRTYQKYRAEAMRNGTYDPDFEKFALGGKTLETWDPVSDGMWTREAPSKYSSLKDWTSNLFDNMQLEYDPELTAKAGGMYLVYSKSPQKMQLILNSNMQDMLKSDLGRYYLNMYGGDINALKNDIIDRNREYTQTDIRPDQVKLHLNDQAFQASEAAKNRAFQREQARQEHDWRMEELEAKALNEAAKLGNKNKLEYNLVADVLNQAQSTMQNYFATHTFGEKNVGNNLGYLMRAQGKAFQNKSFNINDVSFDLPRGGYSAWTGVLKNKLNPTFGYAYNPHEVKGAIVTENELRGRGSGMAYITTYTDRLYKKGNVLGVTPHESSRNGVAIIGRDGRMHVYQKVTVFTTDGTSRDSSGNKYKLINGKWKNITTGKELDANSDDDKALIKSLKQQRSSYTAYQELPAGDVSFSRKRFLVNKDKNTRTAINPGKKIPGTEWYDNGGAVTIDDYDASKHSSKWTNINKTYNQYYKN